MNPRTIALISTFAAIIPISAGLFVLNKAGVLHRLYWLFLVFGFGIDVVVWQLIIRGLKTVAQPFFFFYVLAEPIWLIIFLFNSSNLIKHKKVFRILLLFIFGFWIVAHLDLSIFGWREKTYTNYFNMGYEIIISIIASFCLLKLTQKNQAISNNPNFWFYMGIFIYCFTTFFVNAFIQTEFMQKIWYLHNIPNIIAYLLFTKAFLTIKSSSS